MCTRIIVPSKRKIPIGELHLWVKVIMMGELLGSVCTPNGLIIKSTATENILPCGM